MGYQEYVDHLSRAGLRIKSDGRDAYVVIDEAPFRTLFNNLAADPAAGRKELTALIDGLSPYDRDAFVSGFIHEAFKQKKFAALSLFDEKFFEEKELRLLPMIVSFGVNKLGRIDGDDGFDAALREWLTECSVKNHFSGPDFMARLLFSGAMTEKHLEEMSRSEFGAPYLKPDNFRHKFFGLISPLVPNGFDAREILLNYARQEDFPALDSAIASSGADEDKNPWPVYVRQFLKMEKDYRDYLKSGNRPQKLPSTGM